MMRYKKDAAILFAFQVIEEKNLILDLFGKTFPVTYKIKSWEHMTMILEEQKKYVAEKLPATLNAKDLKENHLAMLKHHLIFIGHANKYLHNKDKGRLHPRSEERRAWLDSEHLAFAIEKFKFFQDSERFRCIIVPEPLPGATLKIKTEPAIKIPEITERNKFDIAFLAFKKLFTLDDIFEGTNSSGIKWIRNILLDKTLQPTEALKRIKFIAARKTDTESFDCWRSRFTFFGLTKGRHPQVEALYLLLRDLPIVQAVYLKPSIDALNKITEEVNTNIALSRSYVFR